MSCQQSAASTPPFCDGGWSPARTSSGEGSASNKGQVIARQEEVADAGGHVSLVPVSPLSYVSLSHQAIKYCLGDPCLTFVDCDKINIVNLELTTTVNLGLARPIISGNPNKNGLLGFESLEIIKPPKIFRRFSKISALCPHW